MQIHAGLDITSMYVRLAPVMANLGVCVMLGRVTNQDDVIVSDFVRNAYVVKSIRQ